MSVDIVGFKKYLLKTSNSIVTLTSFPWCKPKWSRDEFNNQSQTLQDRALGRRHGDSPLPWDVLSLAMASTRDQGDPFGSIPYGSCTPTYLGASFPEVKKNSHQPWILFHRIFSVLALHHYCHRAPILGRAQIRCNSIRCCSGAQISVLAAQG